MIETKTVLVLGAGASAPYGFPTGDALIRGVRDLEGSPEMGKRCGGLLEYIDHLVSDGASSWSGLGGWMKGLNAELYKARPSSIDEFLERRPDLADAGKLAISVLLLRAEEKSGAYLWDDLTGGHWYDYLKARMSGPPQSFEKNQVRIITFNYERSLEHYLCESLRSYYRTDLTEEEYCEIISQIPFVHVYGSLGPLPWQATAASLPEENAVPYGAHDYPYILRASQNIKILHEGVAEDTVQEFGIAQEWLQWADRILFLGFGFHPDNVKRLALGQTLHNKNGTTATCKGLDLTNRQAVEFCTPGTHPHAMGSPRSIAFPNPNADCYTFLYDHVVLS